MNLSRYKTNGYSLIHKYIIFLTFLESVNADAKDNNCHRDTLTLMNAYTHHTSFRKNICDNYRLYEVLDIYLKEYSLILL